jgi:hypothetical protein
MKIWVRAQEITRFTPICKVGLLPGCVQDYEQAVTYRTSVYCLPSKEFTSCTYMAASRLGIPYGLGILPD